MSHIAISYIYLDREFSIAENVAVTHALNDMFTSVSDTRKGRHWEVHDQPAGVVAFVDVRPLRDETDRDHDADLLELGMLPNDEFCVITISTTLGRTADFRVCDEMSRRLSRELAAATTGARLVS